MERLALGDLAKKLWQFLIISKGEAYRTTIGYIPCAPRVKRSAEKIVPASYKFGCFDLRPDERALLSSGDRLHLGGRAFDILLALIERRERVVEFDELLDVVWPGLAVEENNLSVQISSLRKLLGSDVIATVRGKGYRFTAPVQEGSAAATMVSSGPPAMPALAVPAIPDKRVVLAIELKARRHADGLKPGAPGLLAKLLATANGKLVGRADPMVFLAFESARDGVRTAFQIRKLVEGDDATLDHQRCWDLRIAIASFSAKDATPQGPHDEVGQALELVGTANPGEIVVAVDLLADLVAGVDADFEHAGVPIRVSGTLDACRIGALDPEFSPPAPRSSLDDTRPTIAVLPFESLQGGDCDDLLGVALADEVIANLSNCPEFAVISGMSSRRLQRCGLPAMRLAGCLEAGFLLTGSYRVVAGDLILNVQLQEGERGTIVRAMRFERSLSDAFDPADSLGARIAEEVGQGVFKRAMDRSRHLPLQELEGYSLLLGAIGLMHRGTPRDFERSGEMLTYLSERRGGAGTAEAWLAKWHVVRVAQGWTIDAMEDARRALVHVDRSLRSNSRDALALSIGGLVQAYLFKDLKSAGQMYEEALDSNPSEPLAWLFTATREAYLGRGPEAEAASDRALRLSPIDPMKYYFESLAATAALANGSWERSVDLSQRSLTANRIHTSTWRTLTFALVKLDRLAEARAAVQRLLAIEPSYSVSLFKERFPGRGGPLAEPWAEALRAAGLPA